jgi:hypothetical protein
MVQVQHVIYSQASQREMRQTQLLGGTSSTSLTNREPLHLLQQLPTPICRVHKATLQMHWRGVQCVFNTCAL